jgi:geranylgeranyl diphosphate synthase type I
MICGISQRSYTPMPAQTAAPDDAAQFRSFIASTQSRLQPFMEGALHGSFENLREINSDLCDEVRDALKDFCTGGKSIRATLVELGYLIAGGRELNDDLLPIQLSVELTHAALLIHDDIVDHSAKRRDKPTLHVRVSSRHNEKNLRGEASDYGRSVAMLIGDMALCLAHYFALDSKFPDKEKNSALSAFIDNLVKTGLGQIMDIQLSAHISPADAKAILGMTHYKTAYYTVVAPMQLGASLAEGCSDVLLKTISGFGNPLGVAYQLQDDVLGIFGNESDIGKSNLSDLIEGKQTLIMKCGLDLTKGEEHRILKTALRNRKLTNEDLAKIRQILEACGAKKQVQTIAHERKETAIKIISALTTNKRYESVLKGLCNYMVDRDH